MLPQRAGQPVRLELGITLQQLAANAGGAACDALIQPVVTGHLDHGLLARLADPDNPQPLRELQHATAAAAAAGRSGGALELAIALLSGPARATPRRCAASSPAFPPARSAFRWTSPPRIDTIPVHLRRAVRTRDKHCRFPGCDMPPAGCDVHHIKHRKDGGRHALTNMTLLCRFHHLIAIHRWGWMFTLHPDGTTTAVSPDGTKTLHSHPPPVKAA